MVKFFCFEKIVQLFYTHVFTELKGTYSKATQLGIIFGVARAVVSRQADSIVSPTGKPANKSEGISQISSETGAVALATKGLGTRVIVIGTLTGECYLQRLTSYNLVHLGIAYSLVGIPYLYW